MFILEKLSMPGWGFKSDHIEHIFWLLDQSVCNHCKMTEKEYQQFILEQEYEVEEALYPGDLLPETYNQWSLLEKVEWLMGTACGCEFDFYNEMDGSNMKFVEIGVDLAS